MGVRVPALQHIGDTAASPTCIKVSPHMFQWRRRYRGRQVVPYRLDEHWPKDLGTEMDISREQGVSCRV